MDTETPAFTEDPQGQADPTPAWGQGGTAAAPEINDGVYSGGSPNLVCLCTERDKWAVHFEIQRAVQWKTI